MMIMIMMSIMMINAICWYVHRHAQSYEHRHVYGHVRRPVYRHGWQESWGCGRSPVACASSPLHTETEFTKNFRVVWLVLLIEMLRTGWAAHRSHFGSLAAFACVRASTYTRTRTSACPTLRWNTLVETEEKSTGTVPHAAMPTVSAVGRTRNGRMMAEYVCEFTTLTSWIRGCRHAYRLAYHAQVHAQCTGMCMHIGMPHDAGIDVPIELRLKLWRHGHRYVSMSGRRVKSDARVYKLLPGKVI